MSSLTTRIVLLAVPALVGAAPRAPVQESVPNDAVVVAVRSVPPFSMRDETGEWNGISVVLWEDVAQELDLAFEWRELPLDETLDALENGEVDVAVTALTITREREKRIDFSHPYHVGGLTLAFRESSQSAWLATLQSFISFEFLTAVGSLAVVLFAAGTALWFFERRRNRDEFGHGNVARGLGDGFWWSAVTMTTVGYGDKAPKTFGGRLVAVVWMFTSLILVAGFTASIAASLTTNRLASSLLESRDLSELHVGVLAGSTSDVLATARGSRLERYDSLDDALDALEAGTVAAVLHDEPILRHHARVDRPWLELAPQTVLREDYGFGLPQGSPLREPINGGLLAILPKSEWRDVLRRYLGE